MLGVGAILCALSDGGQSSLDAISSCVGKVLTSVRLDPDGNNGDGCLLLGFGDATLRIQDRGRSCCESRYMHTDDDLQDFVGGQLAEIDVRPWDTKEKVGDYHETQLLLVTTTKGSFTVVTHNEHNGYYGGFWVVADILREAGKEE